MLGTDSVTTGGTIPTFVDFSITAPLGMQALFDTFFCVVSYTGGYVNGFTGNSTLSQLLGSTTVSVIPLQAAANQAVFWGTVYPGINSLLFDELTTTLFSPNYAANTLYTCTFYGMRTTTVSEINRQYVVAETDGTITTAGAWQLVYQFTAYYSWFLFQNQGSGKMYVSGSGNTTPLGNGMIVLPYGTFGIDNFIMQPAGDVPTTFYVKGDTPGDAWAFQYVAYPL